MGLGGLTPELACQGRTSITEIEAQRFRTAYDHHRERACTARGITLSSERSDCLRASIDRVALSRP